MRQLLILIRGLFYLPVRLLNFFILKISKVKNNQLKIFGLISIINSGTIIIGAGTKINSSKYKNMIGGDTRTSLVVHKGASLIIGKEVKISNTAIQCTKSITIGDYAMIGGSCKIWDNDFHSLDPKVRRETPNENFESEPINIGKNVFIGGFSIILKGVTIGDNSVIAAGSVVSKEIPPNEIWGGNPAKFIRKL